jgi:TonB family protein
MSTAISLLIPLIHIPVYVLTPELSVVPYEDEMVDIAVSAFVQKTSNVGLTDILFLVYGLTALGLIVFELRSLWKINLMKKGASSLKVNNVKIYRVDSQLAPFSFFNTIFWRNEIDINSPDGQQILQHELLHVRAYHSYDKLFMQLLCTVFWMNPVFWLLRRELNMVHEYAADNACVNDNDTRRLSALILCSLYPNHYLDFSNSFFQSNIKRRLVMLSRKCKKQKFSLLRQLMVIPLILLTLVVFAVSIEAQQVRDKEIIPFAKVEEKPLFQSKDAGEFVKWIYSKLNYPKEAQEKNIQGVVRIGFTINEDGSLSDMKSLQKVDPLLENAVIEIIKQSPKWTPGKHKNTAVKVTYQVPVVFKLNEENAAKYTTATCDAQGAKDTVKKVYMQNFVPERSKIVLADDGTEIVPFPEVEEKPLFQDKEAHEFIKWIYDKLQGNYPKEAIEKNIQGVVRIEFTINEDGSLSDIKSLQKVDPILENAVTEIIKQSPKWTPGKHKSKVVKVTYQVPVVFKLTKENAAKNITNEEITIVSFDNQELERTFANDEIEVIPFAIVEEKPMFQNKEASEFIKWIYDKLKGNYPKEAMEKNIQGVVRVAFIINEDGSLSNIKYLRKVDPILKNAVTEIIKQSPKWTPGKHKNTAVKVTYQVPIVFKLQ